MARNVLHTRRAVRRSAAVGLAVVLGLGVVPATSAPSGAVVSPAVLRGIACKGPSFCVVVGYLYDQSRPYIARYDGAHWLKSASPAVNGGHLQDVACTSAGNCFAVGSRGSSPTAMIERWDGSAWRVMTIPHPSGYSTLLGVTCVSAAFCVAVGHKSTPATTTLVEHWNGKAWKIVPSPNRSNNEGGPNDNLLYAVSCVSVSTCFAVGRTQVGSVDDTYIVRWNGHGWSFSTHQNVNGDLETLFDVSCPASNRCLAVGQTDDASPTLALKDRWDGKTWHLTGSHETGNDLLFSGVSCVAATSCLAVGVRNLGDGYAEYFNGSTWKAVSASQIASIEILRVACVQSHSCYAIGESVVAHWNGSSWKVVANL